MRATWTFVLAAVVVFCSEAAGAKECGKKRSGCAVMITDAKKYGVHGHGDDPKDRAVSSGSDLTWTFRHPKSVGSSLDVTLDRFDDLTNPTKLPCPIISATGRDVSFNPGDCRIEIDLGDDYNGRLELQVRTDGLYLHSRFKFHLKVTDSVNNDTNDIDPELEIDTASLMPAWTVVLGIVAGMIVVSIGYLVWRLRTQSAR